MPKLTVASSFNMIGFNREIPDEVRFLSLQESHLNPRILLNEIYPEDNLFFSAF